MWGLGMAYGEKWRRWRKVRARFKVANHTQSSTFQLQHAALNPKYAVNYKTFQALESTVLLKDLLMSPNNYLTHFDR